MKLIAGAMLAAIFSTLLIIGLSYTMNRNEVGPCTVTTKSPPAEAGGIVLPEQGEHEVLLVEGDLGGPDIASGVSGTVRPDLEVDPLTWKKLRVGRQGDRLRVGTADTAARAVRRYDCSAYRDPYSVIVRCPATVPSHRPRPGGHKVFGDVHVDSDLPGALNCVEAAAAPRQGVSLEYRVAVGVIEREPGEAGVKDHVVGGHAGVFAYESDIPVRQQRTVLEHVVRKRDLAGIQVRHLDERRTTLEHVLHGYDLRSV